MANLCPNCDKPLREGAKFCTNCGHVIQRAEAAPPPQGAHPTPAPTTKPSPQGTQAALPSSGNVFCPYCGKANRQGVQFCRNCGKPLPSAQKAAPAPSGMKIKPQRSRARLVTIGFLVFVILMICVSVVGIGWGFGVDGLLFPSPTPTPMSALLNLSGV